PARAAARGPAVPGCAVARHRPSPLARRRQQGNAAGAGRRIRRQRRAHPPGRGERPQEDEGAVRRLTRRNRISARPAERHPRAPFSWSISMAYVIRGLPAQPFQPLFGLDDAALEARGMRRYVADGPGYPCRISLEDAAPGETLILLHWNHLDADSPYRSAGPIFVRESARPQGVFHNMV